MELKEFSSLGYLIDEGILDWLVLETMIIPIFN
jgi:hypothetical protein